MATVSFLLLLVVLTTTSSGAAVHAAEADMTHLHFFLHDILSGTNPTAVQVIKGPSSGGSVSAGPIPGITFGDTTVIDDPLTATSAQTSALVGRAQGFYMMSSQSGAVLMVCVNLLLTSGDYNGSTLAVVGRDDIMADVRELSVVGGTGKFRMARGYVLWKTSSMSGADAHIELDVYVSTSTTNGTDASAPVDGGGGGGGSTTGKSSSGAAAVAYGGGWVSACVAAVLVAAVVGRGW